MAFQIDWDPYVIVSKLGISPLDITKAETLFGNRAMVKKRGNNCCPGLYFITMHDLKSGEIAGVDLPCLITNTKNEKAETIMIIGQAPYRRKCGKEKMPQYSIGTPYAIQFADYPDQCWVYKQIFMKLLKRYHLYLTDATKVYTNQKTYSFNKYDWEKILKDEIESVRPKVIVTFGNRAMNMLKKTGCTRYTVRNILHPGPRNSSRWEQKGIVYPCCVPDEVVKNI